jgi:hypothetical protein
MSHGLSYGVRKTGATIAGLQAGLLLILLIAGAGVGSLLLASEVAFSVVKVLGACYLIYVGWSQWRAGATSPIQGNDAAPAGPWKKRFLTGFLTNATNPKGIIFMVAVLPQFIPRVARGAASDGRHRGGRDRDAWLRAGASALRRPDAQCPCCTQNRCLAGCSWRWVRAVFVAWRSTRELKMLLLLKR